MAGAFSVSVPVSPATLTTPFCGIDAWPMKTVILFFFIRWPMPELSCLATPRERLTTASRS